jgi:hypothetical protein
VQSLNGKAESFVAGLKRYAGEWQARGVKLLLIRDTPLMNVVATSSACALQIKLFGQSICKVSRTQDLHTRSVQDKAFNTLAALSDNVLLWDPLPLIYRDRPYLDVVSENGNYIMWDWNHITEQESVRLAPMFKEFISEKVLNRVGRFQ